MALRAIIFDYGRVLSAQPDADAHTQLVAATGLEDAAFEDHYWAHRHDFDSGILNAHSYWEKIASDGKFALTPQLRDTLIEHDSRMWGNLNQPMVDWAQRLVDEGFLVGILSNMGDATRDHLLREHKWLQRLHHLTWSCELLIAKPDPAIYLHTLEKLKVAPGEAMFIDDLAHNIAAARAVGMDGVQFTDVAQLRKDLEARGLQGVIPFPVEG